MIRDMYRQLWVWSRLYHHKMNSQQVWRRRTRSYNHHSRKPEGTYLSGSELNNQSIQHNTNFLIQFSFLIFSFQAARLSGGLLDWSWATVLQTFFRHLLLFCSFSLRLLHIWAFSCSLWFSSFFVKLFKTGLKIQEAWEQHLHSCLNKCQ